jgi:hypothetical protein
MQLAFPPVHVQDKHTSRRASSSCGILSSSAAGAGAAAGVLRFGLGERGRRVYSYFALGDAIRGPKFSPARSVPNILFSRDQAEAQSLEFPHYFFSRSPFLNSLSFSSSRIPQTLLFPRTTSANISET